jgi:hypothetical protein
VVERVRSVNSVSPCSFRQAARTARRPVGPGARGPQAAELELQYDAHGYRTPETVRRVDPPVPVEAWQRAGVLDAWPARTGLVGRVRLHDGTFVWIRDTNIRRAEAS